MRELDLDTWEDMVIFGVVSYIILLHGKYLEVFMMLFMFKVI